MNAHNPLGCGSPAQPPGVLLFYAAIRRNDQAIREGCVPNKTGKGHHDDKTGHPCSTGTGDAGKPAAGKAPMSAADKQALLAGRKVAVDSSAASEVQYHAGRQEFTVTWRDGSTPTTYPDVSSLEARLFAAAKSKGQFINANFKGVRFETVAKELGDNLHVPAPFAEPKNKAKVKKPNHDEENHLKAIPGKTLAANQRWAEGNQAMVAVALGGRDKSLSGNGPVDVAEKDTDGYTRRALEMKTLLESKTGEVAVDDAAHARKEAWVDGELLIPQHDYDKNTHGKILRDEHLPAEGGKGFVHYHVVSDPTFPPGGKRQLDMVVVDDREQWAKRVKGQLKQTQRTIGRHSLYYARGVGSVAIGKRKRPPLILCDSPAIVQHLRSLPDAEVDRIAVEHQYGRLSYPSKKQVADRGEATKGLDFAGRELETLRSRKRRLAAAQQAAKNANTNRLAWTNRLPRLEKQYADFTPTNRNDIQKQERLRRRVAHAKNQVKASVVRMKRNRRTVGVLAPKVERSQAEWYKVRNGLPATHPLKKAE
jgi:hypothetical protein